MLSFYYIIDDYTLNISDDYTLNISDDFTLNIIRVIL